MELTIEQALQQGVAAHKEGKLQDAERLYRAILQSTPLHPDDNHNLGILAVSVNKADVALALPKTAFEANPAIMHYRNGLFFFIKLCLEGGSIRISSRLVYCNL
jgi:hypothetical protein